MTLYAAVRGSTLYVATWDPEPGFGSDHFIMVGTSIMEPASTPAPWQKNGLISVEGTTPYLAAESSNEFAGWFNVGTAGNEVFRGGAGAQMEGSLDLSGAFLEMPTNLYLAAVAYQTDDAGSLVSQAPAGNGDGNLDASEFFMVPLEALRDEDADGIFDRLQANGLFRVTEIERQDSDSVRLRWNSFPGRSYRVETLLSDGSWAPVTGSEVTASQSDIENEVVLTSQNADRGIYRVVLLP